MKILQVSNYPTQTQYQQKQNVNFGKSPLPNVKAAGENSIYGLISKKKFIPDEINEIENYLWLKGVVDDVSLGNITEIEEAYKKGHAEGFFAVMARLEELLVNR